MGAHVRVGVAGDGLPGALGGTMECVTAYDIFSIDPGETTGWAWLRVDLDRLGSGPAWKAVVDWEADEIQAVGVSPREGVRRWDGGEAFAASWLVAKIEEVQPAMLVVEDFILDVRRANSSRNLLSPVRITAMVEYGLRTSLVVPVRRLGAPGGLVFQTAADAKTIITNTRLERWGFYVPRKQCASPHVRDALRHGLLYCRTVQRERRGAA